MSSYGNWQNYSGYMSLWKIRFWGWNGQSRDVDENFKAIESLNTDFVRAFTEEHVREILESNFEISMEKVESIEPATEDEDYAWSSGWSNGWEFANGSGK